MVCEDLFDVYPTIYKLHICGVLVHLHHLSFYHQSNTLAVLDQFLAGFSRSNKVNFQNCFANKFIR